MWNRILNVHAQCTIEESGPEIPTVGIQSYIIDQISMFPQHFLRKFIMDFFNYDHSEQLLH